MFQAVLPLAARDSQGRFFPSGSAVFVAPGVAITALHVIQDYSTRLDGIELSAETVAGRTTTPSGFSIFARQMVNADPVLWRAASFTTADPLDLCILKLVRADGTIPQGAWPPPKVRFAPPTVGEPVFAVGFPRQVVEGFGPTPLQWEAEAFLAAGVVDEVHPQFRDRGRLRFPCFQTNARFDGGMSGGPVVNAAGELCGIICSNLRPYESEDEHVSYVSLLWPALGVTMPQSTLASPGTEAVALRALFERGLVDSDDWESVRVADDGRTFHLTQFNMPATGTDRPVAER